MILITTPLNSTSMTMLRHRSSLRYIATSIETYATLRKHLQGRGCVSRGEINISRASLEIRDENSFTFRLDEPILQTYME